MQLALVRELVGLYVTRIVDDIIPGETGAARLQQIGLFTLVFVLERNGEPVTADRLAKITDQSKSAVQKQLQKLEDIDVIERRKALNKSGRGRAFHLFIKHNEKTKKLLKAIGGTAGARKKRRS
jgi:predicted transcriptional regulator